MDRGELDTLREERNGSSEVHFTGCHLAFIHGGPREDRLRLEPRRWPLYPDLICPLRNPLELHCPYGGHVNYLTLQL